MYRLIIWNCRPVFTNHVVYKSLPTTYWAHLHSRPLKSAEQRLLEDLHVRIPASGFLARPVVNSSMPVVISFEAVLWKILEVDEHDQSIKLQIKLHLVSPIQTLLFLC